MSQTDGARDARGRLTSEKRSLNGSPTPVYDFEYEYDQGGNRTKKTEHIFPGFSWIEELYTYDTASPESVSNNNRLLSYTRRSLVPQALPPMAPMMQAPAAPPPPEPEGTLLSTTWYSYNQAGNVTSVTTHSETAPPDEPDISRTRFEYASNGRAVTFVLGETWGNGQPFDITYAREFRYDGARQRYLTRVLNADALENSVITVDSEIWSDYDGDEIYGDYEISGQDVTELRSFEPGLGKVDPWQPGGPFSAEYYHADMIGTTRFMTDAVGNTEGEVVYTAFGERIDGAHHRYGYAGAWAYQGPSSDDPGDPYLDFPFLHVGARYYDPATGRFLQRDPIGVGGGLNVYLYVGANPLRFVDPSGSDWIDVILNPIWKRLPPGFHEVVGGGGHIPVLDPGPWQDGVLIASGVASVAAPAGAARAAGYALKVGRFRHGGFGATLVRHGTPVHSRLPTAIHKNPFNYKGQVGNRWHYHRGRTNSQWKKHRPYHGC